MSAIVRTPECFPERAQPFSNFMEPWPADGIPRHEECPGGQTAPGVLGGWTCPCECHRSTALAAAAPSSVAGPPSAAGGGTGEAQGHRIGSAGPVQASPTSDSLGWAWP